MADKHYMQFITGIHFTKDLLKLLNGITFLFDPEWEAEKSEMATFPISFFHVKTCSAIMDSEISQKKMMFYDSGKTVTNTSVSNGLINVVADNAVTKPKQYKLTVIIPYYDITLINNTYALQPEQFTAATSLLTSGEEKTNNISPYLTCATPYINIIKSVLRQFVLADYSDTESFISSVLSTPDYNRNSLEQMWLNRDILKLKLWTGWHYKYVCINHFEVSKQYDEDGVYEASLTVQEMPIMTIRGDAGLTYKGYVNPILSASGEKIKKIINGREIK